MPPPRGTAQQRTASGSAGFTIDQKGVKREANPSGGTPPAGAQGMSPPPAQPAAADAGGFKFAPR
jgi:hypothetical protein